MFFLPQDGAIYYIVPRAWKASSHASFFFNIWIFISVYTVSVIYILITYVFAFNEIIPK